MTVSPEYSDMDLASYAGPITSSGSSAEICVVAEDSLVPPDNRLRLGELRSEIFYTDTFGRKQVTVPAFSAYLMDLFCPVTVSGLLWVYDRETGLYRKNDHVVEAEIQRLLDGVLFRGPVVALKKDLLSRLTDSRVREESLRCWTVSLSRSRAERWFRYRTGRICLYGAGRQPSFPIHRTVLQRENSSSGKFPAATQRGNGKGVLIEWILRVIGQLGGRVAPRELFSGNLAVRETTLAAHAHRHLLVVSEAGGGVLNDELLKRLTGDSVVPLNAIYAGEREYRMNGTLVFVTNAPPVFSSGGKEMMRREVCVPFDLDVPPDAQDEGLPERLATPEGNRWLLGKMIAGALEYVRTADKPQFWRSFCSRITGDSREVLAGQDSLGEFVRACLVPEEGARTPGREVFARWYAWEFGDEQEMHEARGGRGLRRNANVAELYAGLRMRGISVERRMRVEKKVASNVLVNWRLANEV